MKIKGQREDTSMMLDDDDGGQVVVGIYLLFSISGTHLYIKDVGWLNIRSYLLPFHNSDYILSTKSSTNGHTFTQGLWRVSNNKNTT
jgi:hypothetical protein